jgi:acetone carboxylase, gamma subunit
MAGVTYSIDTIDKLVDGVLPWQNTKKMISDHKDEDRFEKYMEVLKKKVPWKDKMLLRLTEDLYIVQKDNDRIIKCACGYEYGDYRQNWKLKALIYVLDEKDMDILWPNHSHPDPEYNEIREYYCPGCGTQLEVESVPVGYPPIMDFLPDLDTFYAEWLDRPLPDKKEFRDLTADLTRTW